MSIYSNFAYFYDKLTQNVDYKKRANYFNEILKNNGIKNGLLLDLACGTGNLSIELEKLGYDVIGVDGSNEMLSIAMEKKYDTDSNIMYLCQDMIDLDLYGTIDVAICALDSLNHIVDRDLLQDIIKRVSLFLNHNAIFIFDVNTHYKHKYILGDNSFVYDYDDIYCVWQNEYLSNGRVEITLDLFEKQDDIYKRYQESFCEQAYSFSEFENIVKNAGLQILNIFDEDSFNKPNDKSQRLIYVTKKVK